MLTGAGPARLQPLLDWLEAFKPCFGHRAELVSPRRYVPGLLSDGRRKAMSAMLEQVTDPDGEHARASIASSTRFSALAN